MNANTLLIIIYLSGLPKTQNSKEKEYIKNTKNKHSKIKEEEIYNNTY